MTPPVATAEEALLRHEGLLPRPTERRGPGGNRRRSGRAWWAALAVAAVAWSLVRAGVGHAEVVNPGGWRLVGRFLEAALHPELSGPFLRTTWDATLTTLSYAVLGTALSVGIGTVLGVLGSQTWWQVGRTESGGRRRLGGWLVARGALSLPRGVHEAVWGLFLVRILGLDPLVGILAIAIPYGAVTAKVFAEVLDETPRGAYAALRSTGVGRLKGLCYTLVPQAMPDLVSYAFYRFECSIRAAAILGVIGAGGLGFQLALSFQSLRYEEMWTLIYALLALSGLADWWSSALRSRSRSDARASRPVALASGSVGRRRDRFLTCSLLAAGVLPLVAAWHLRLDLHQLWAGRTRQLLSDIAGSAWPPDAAPGTLARLALQTVEMSVLATAVAALAGALVALAAARRSARWPARIVAAAARVVLLLCRAVPPPVWALLFLFVLFPGPLPGALALAAYNFGILGRLMAEVVENLDDRPARALRAQGAPPAVVLAYGVLPLALPRFVSYAVYRWEVTLRETVVVGLVGAGGLGRLLSAQLASFDYRGVSATLLVLVILTLAADLVGSAVRRSLR